MKMRSFGYLWMSATLVAAGVTGCASKKYVRNQTAPIIQHAGQLNDETAENTRKIHDVDQRAQEGIQKAQSSADSANQNAQNASQQASNAQNSANDAVNRADSLDSVVKDLDNYKQVKDVAVHFAFNKAALTADDRQQLDGFASQLSSANNYILEVTGGTDSAGPSQYNYDLSQRRADAVVQYLASKYNIPARKFYLIGIGKDQYVASNKTREGRAQNRRVEVQMLQNVGMQTAGQGSPTGASSQPNQSAPTSDQSQPSSQSQPSDQSQPNGQAQPSGQSTQPSPQSSGAAPSQTNPSAQSSSAPEE
ncbi:MAG TPA: OmpA family protein [Terracidiphilus sp.]|nr:OmpA family protein [Terracidiphilus sp.]